MLFKIRKQRFGGVKVTANFPINAESRAYVDTETNRVRHSIIPIIGDNRGRPYLVGSAVALTFRGRKCLSTALHVIRGSEGRPLFFFDANGLARQLCGSFEFDEQCDIAAIQLSKGDVEALSHIPFLAEDSIGSAAATDGRFYASVAGYPHTAAKLIDNLTIDPRMEIYSNKAREDIGGVISVMFDKKQGALGEIGLVLPRDPIGKSGGAIFGIPLLGMNGVQTWATIKLVGIPTDWNRTNKSIVGASSAKLTTLLEKVIA